MATYPITMIWASTTSNTVTFSTSEIGNGIVYEGLIVSNQLNGIAQFITTAIRHTQTTGELYDNTQTYNASQYCSQLLNTNGINKLVFFQNASGGDLVGTPPLKGTEAVNQNDIVVISDDSSLIEDSTNWNRVIVDSTLIKTANPTANNMYQLVNLSNQTFGEMKIKTYNTSGNLHCVFDLDIYTMMGEIQFNIKNVLYSSTIRQSSTTYSSYANIFFVGFGLVLTSNGLYFGVTNNTLCTKIEVEYSKMNFIPTLQQTTLPTPNASTAKIYAIRNGGGTFIQDLGVIKSDYRANGNNALGETLEFYLFSNGFVRWTSAMTLDSNYFHQWANGNFGSLNVDASDKILCNVGTTTGQSLGVIASASLPNIRGDTHRPNNNQTGLWAWGHNSNMSASGAFIVRTNAPQGILSTYNTGYMEYLVSFLLAFDASVSDPTYQDNAKVNMERIPNFLVVQAF